MTEINKPKAAAKLEIIIKGTDNEFGLDRISIPLSGDSLYKMAAQLENINGQKDTYHFENEHIAIWLFGRIEWESEEHRKEYLAQSKYIKL